MKLISLNRLDGPNLYSSMSVVVARLDTEACASLSAEVLLQNLAWLPEGSVRPLIRGIVERLARQDPQVTLSALAGWLASALEEERFQQNPRAIRLRPTLSEGIVDVMIETNDPDVGRRAVMVAVETCDLLSADRAPSAETQRRLSERFQQYWKGRSAVRFNWATSVITEAARELGVPVAKYLPDRPFAMLGQGCKSKRLTESMSDDVSAMAATLSKDKIIASEVLHHCFVPIPAQRLVSGDAEARDAVRALGTPLVVKGRATDKGTSVTTGITTSSELNRAIAKVRALGDQVILQRHIPGDDYRITVAYGRVLAVARREAASVLGDGRRSVAELVAARNLERSRSGPLANWFTPMAVDEEARAMLAKVDLEPESIPGAGRKVILASTANLSTGGSAIDVTEDVHPSIISQSERVARSFRLSIAGVDVITTDISKPLAETGGVFIEVNATPGLRPHYLADRPRDIAREIVQEMFPAGDQGRIPTIGVTGTNGKTACCRMIAMAYEQAGSLVGMSSTAGVSIGSESLASGDYASGASARALLRDPALEVGVFELARGGLLRRGLCLEDLEVAVVTNVSADHLGQAGVETVEDLARIKRMVAEIARRGVVLNADDPLCTAMAEHVSAPIWWTSDSADNATVSAHRRADGNAVVIDRVDGADCLVHYQGDKRAVLMRVAEIPATLNGTAEHNVRNALSAAAALLAMNLPADLVRRGLASFDNSPAVNPGRLNMREAGGVQLVYDYVHNVAGMKEIGRLLQKTPVKGRRVCLLAHIDKRPDLFYVEYARIAATFFDVFVVTEERDKGTRAAGEITELLCTGLKEAGVEQKHILTATDIEQGVLRAFDVVQPGDQLLLTGGYRQPMWEWLDRFIPSRHKASAAMPREDTA